MGRPRLPDPKPASHRLDARVLLPADIGVALQQVAKSQCRTLIKQIEFYIRMGLGMDGALPAPKRPDNLELPLTE